MLVLSRKVGEKIHIGNDVLVEVRRISGNRVTLALRAPRDVRILRAELRTGGKCVRGCHRVSRLRNDQPVDIANEWNNSVVAKRTDQHSSH